MGIARMPCYLPDAIEAKLHTSHNVPSSLKRLPIAQSLSDWGVWVLSHVDLRHTARVRACREFLIQHLVQKKDLFLGEKSAMVGT